MPDPATAIATIDPAAAARAAAIVPVDPGEKGAAPLAQGRTAAAASAPASAVDGAAGERQPPATSTAPALRGAVFSSDPAAPVSPSGSATATVASDAASQPSSPDSVRQPPAPEAGEAPRASGASGAPSAATAVAAPAILAGPQAPDPSDAPAAAPRAVAAQVSPAVVSIAQRPAGSHQLTMTVNPDTLGPVTVRAHISATGDVQVELIGGSDAGRDALRAIVVDLRRDLAAVLPHASLSIGSGSADSGTPDRGAPTGGAGSGENPSSHREGARADPGRASAPESARRHAEPPAPSTDRAGDDARLDIFA
ncbi:hypothetical protein [Streptomyces sp. AC495_CC817]|uniref:hypothetical protein n=1 Tax=Streptomyces sp. AC495_CC817 TaxID=2823900 RepID=UPI001C264F9C|nr:hypothetical protein [Streptomyces sp. AC495_CC817]